MNWLIRIARYSIPEIAPRRWSNYNERQKIIEAMKLDARKEAQQIAERNGHQLHDEWDAMNATHCTQCGSRIYIRVGDWYDSMAKPRIEGFVVEKECPKEMPLWIPDWTAQRLVKDSYPGSLYQ